MAAGSRTPREKKVAVGTPGYAARLAEWRQMLAQCSRKPTRKRVHNLRIVILRIQAELQHRFRDDGADAESTIAANRWIKQAEKLRQVMGDTRETDVWIGKLGSLRTSLRETGTYVPRSNRECLRQIDRLEDKLQLKRRELEQDLQGELEDCRKQMVGISKDVEGMAESEAAGKMDGGAEDILKQFAEVAAEFPTLDGENLHEFRKRIKTVRYLAEMLAVDHPETRQPAALLKKMQSAIGEWHDWQQLARMSRRMHEGRKKYDELSELLEALTAESLEKALDVCERLAARLLKSDRETSKSFMGDGRKPPRRSAMVISALEDAKLA